MAAKHTPGPWMVDGGRVRSLAYGTVASIAAAGVRGNPYTAECRDANARLIAAAPELLEALRALLWQHDHNGGVLCGMALQDARAAVARATEFPQARICCLA